MLFEAFILIGGRSSRFGSDKALARLGSVTLAENAASILEKTEGCTDITFVAASETQFAASEMPRNVIFDRNRSYGAWSGLETALSASKRDLTFLLACDLPFVTPRLVESLVRRLEKDEALAAVPIQPDGRPQPLCGVYRTTPVLGLVNAKFAGGETLPSLISFVREIGAAMVEPKEGDRPDSFANINTRGDLEKALRSRS